MTHVQSANRHATSTSASMMYLHVVTSACALSAAQGFGFVGGKRTTAVRRNAGATTAARRNSKISVPSPDGISPGYRQGARTSVTMVDGDAVRAVSQMLLAYSDEAATAAKSVTFMSELIGVGGIATVGLFGVLASVLNLQKTPEIELTEEERDAVTATNLLYDATSKDQEVTESGTVGEVKRKALAMKARQQYQSGKDPREVRDKTLSYVEFDLPYLAKMLRLSQLEAGEVFLDMGSGMGKACLAAGLLYPDLAVCRGVELLDGLHREAESYARKYKSLRRPKAPVQFLQGDFCDPDLDISDVDVVFAYSTKYATEGIYLSQLSRKLTELKPKARVITIDKRLQGPFNLISTVMDPNGDLQTSTGYLWQRQ